jgi:hypothetical protein
MTPGGPGPASEGRLVDVSARGLCVESPRLGVRVGQPVCLEITLEGREAPASARCILEGTGRVVWVHTERVRCRAGLRFDRPVSVKAPFSTSE